METRSGIPLDEIAPPPTLRDAVAAVLQAAFSANDYEADRGDMVIDASIFDVLRAAYDATPEPMPALSAEERAAIGRARKMCYFWAEIRGVDSPEYHADMAVLARFANGGK